MIFTFDDLKSLEEFDWTTIQKSSIYSYCKFCAALHMSYASIRIENKILFLDK